MLPQSQPAGTGKHCCTSRTRLPCIDRGDVHEAERGMGHGWRREKTRLWSCYFWFDHSAFPLVGCKVYLLGERAGFVIQRVEDRWSNCYQKMTFLSPRLTSQSWQLCIHTNGGKSDPYQLIWSTNFQDFLNLFSVIPKIAAVNNWAPEDNFEKKKKQNKKKRKQGLPSLQPYNSSLIEM